ncbi:MAG: hypothetical protein GXO42_00955 [bacterium]|nr:hypothetical protein [bacterium]
MIVADAPIISFSKPSKLAKKFVQQVLRSKKFSQIEQLALLLSVKEIQAFAACMQSLGVKNSKELRKEHVKYYLYIAASVPEVLVLFLRDFLGRRDLAAAVLAEQEQVMQARLLLLNYLAWLKKKRLEEHQLAAAYSAAKKFLAYMLGFKGVTLRQLSAKHIKQFAEEALGKLSASKRREILASLLHFFKFLERQDLQAALRRLLIQ